MATAKPKPGIKVVLPNGNRVPLKDVGKSPGTPKATPKPKPTYKLSPSDAKIKAALEKKYPGMFR